MKDLIKHKKIIFIVLVFLLIFVAYTKINQQMEIDRLAKEKARYEAEIKRLELLKASLEDELKNAQQPQYIEDVARYKLRMVKPDEMIYIIHEE